MTEEDIYLFEQKAIQFLQDECHSFDDAHDLTHIRRVVSTAKQLAQEEQAVLAVVIPAAWLHDCVSLPKNHPDREFASKYAADRAVDFLTQIKYSQGLLAGIHHAIVSHSYSANCSPQTLEAKIVQDADRLDALGAIGIARCIQVSASLNRSLYASDDAFCEQREPDDKCYTIDHFYSKLFNITDSLNTTSARLEGQKRERVMRDFLAALKTEL
ncbi:HD domain-containing protein [Marinomonas epiphytica]